jgi:hypothetical protein
MNDSLAFWVILDDAEARIARGYWSAITIYTNVAHARIYVDNVLMGFAPLTVSIEHRKTYQVKAEADGSVTQTKPMDDTMFNVIFELVPLVPWWKGLIDSILNILKKIFGGS